jgi:sucrose-6-phosphate hydrolase SacC (GH32 family)
LIEFRQPGGESRWLLKVDTFAGHPGGTGAQVFIGHFDGTRFTATSHGDPGHPAHQGLWVDCGSDFYAALSWANLPPQASAHGPRPVWLAWMNNHAYAKHTPTEPWRGAMSVPRELFLVDTPAGPRLGQAPVAALQSLRGAARTWQALSLPDGDTLLDLGPHIDGRCCEVEWVVSEANAAEFGLRVRCGGGEFTRIGVDTQRGCLFIDRQHSGFVPDAPRWAGRREAPLRLDGLGRPDGEPLTLRVLIDRCSVEVFSGDGLSVLTELVFPADTRRGLCAWVQGGTVAHSTLTVWPLRPVRACAPVA